MEMSPKQRMADRALSLILDDHALNTFTSEQVRKKLGRRRDGEDDGVWWGAKTLAVQELLLGAMRQNTPHAIACETVEGRLADILDDAEVRFDEYKLSNSDKGTLAAALRFAALLFVPHVKRATNDRSASEQAHEAQSLDAEASLWLKKYLQEFLLARGVTLEDHHAISLTDALVQRLSPEVVREFMRDKQ